MTTAEQPQREGELEYGSILPNGDDWRLRRFDGGMGETEYRMFRNEKFFAMFDNRTDADIVMVAMTTSNEQEKVLEVLKKYENDLENIKKMMDEQKEFRQR